MRVKLTSHHFDARRLQRNAKMLGRVHEEHFTALAMKEDRDRLVRKKEKRREEQ
jgi:hypothetical protein